MGRWVMGRWAMGRWVMGDGAMGDGAMGDGRWAMGRWGMGDGRWGDAGWGDGGWRSRDAPAGRLYGMMNMIMAMGMGDGHANMANYPSVPVRASGSVAGSWKQ
jgi:hypothetical protein